MKYVEVSIEEAMKRCKKNAKVLVAEQDLENDDCEIRYQQYKLDQRHSQRNYQRSIIISISNVIIVTGILLMINKK